MLFFMVLTCFIFAYMCLLLIFLYYSWWLFIFHVLLLSFLYFFGGFPHMFTCCWARSWRSIEAANVFLNISRASSSLRILIVSAMASNSCKGVAPASSPGKKLGKSRKQKNKNKYAYMKIVVACLVVIFLIFCHSSWPRRFSGAPLGGNLSCKPPGAFQTAQGQKLQKKTSVF